MKFSQTTPIKIEKLAETISTNEYLAEQCAHGNVEEFHTVFTEFQTSGKGQRGNSWESEAGKNLLFSTVLYPTTLEAKQQFNLSILVTGSILDALEQFTEGFSIKWPNDIYWKDKKIAGILIENILEGKYISQCIIGIGLNVNQKEFHSSAPNPVSLAQIIGEELNREELLERILHNIVAGYRAMEKNYPGIQEALRLLYLLKLYRRHGFYPYQDKQGQFMAEFYQIDSDGHLYLKDEEGNIRKYAFKEVTYLL